MWRLGCLQRSAISRLPSFYGGSLQGPSPQPQVEPQSPLQLHPTPSPAGPDCNVTAGLWRQPVVGRTLMTKARRARLAAAVALAERELNAEPTPGAALIHSQRVQELRAEEALLAASLQRLRAERQLATSRHECEAELQTFRQGVASREAAVSHLIAEGAATALKLSTAALEEQETVPCLSSSDTACTPPSLTGILATHDAEAAAKWMKPKRQRSSSKPKKTATNSNRRSPSRRSAPLSGSTSSVSLSASSAGRSRNTNKSKN